MDLDIFKNIDPSGRMSKESFLLKNYPEEYNYIIEYCISNNIFDITFKEKVYLTLHNLNKVPICANKSCNKKVKFKNSNIGYLLYCSNKCVSSDPNIKSIKESKSLLKFGTKTPAESADIKNKIISTNQEKYGANSAMCLIEIQNKSKETLLKNWGVDNPNKSSEILKKRIDSFKIGSYKETYRKTSIEKYGVNHPWMNKEVHNKSIISSNLSKNQSLKTSILKKLPKEYQLVSIDYDKYKRNIIINCSICENNFEINREDFQIRYKNKTTICKNCNPIGSSQSGTEMELYKFIRNNYNGEIILNSKSLIHPKEIDIYLPDLRLAFEFNGLYWHSESQKGKHYHYDKTKLCNQVGISLTHIWEDDWVYKNDIIKSIILNKIGIISNKIYARKCRVIQINDQLQSKKFLNDNHILGNCSSSIKLGLYYNNILISMMCFTRSKSSYNLDRFCSLLNTIVIGGSSKLFKYFVDNFNPEIITSYSDESMFSGNIYKTIGFYLDGYSEINYKWVLSKKREHKSKYRKDRLVKSGFDSSKSESEIMINNIGAFRIWDCGLKRWIWKNNINF